MKEAWVRVMGLPLHLWTSETLKQIGDGCGGFLKVDEETRLRTETSWARILVRLKEIARPSIVNILAGSRSYELQIWWELPPWVAEVYPSKMEAGTGMQKRWEEDEYNWRMAKGASSGSAHTKFDWRARRKGDLMAMQVGDPLSHAIATSRAAARSPRTAPDPDGGCRVKMLGTLTVDPPSKARPEGLSPIDVGTSPLIGREPRPKGFSHFSHGLGPGCPSSSRPKEISQDKARTPSFLPKSILVRAKDPILSSAEERYCPPMPLYYSPSSPCLDRIPHLEEFFGHWGIEEISHAPEGSESVGSQGIALTPLAILPPSSSTRPLCRDLVAVEEREVQQCEDGDKEDTRGKEFLVEERESWEESCLSRFSKFLGFSTSGHEEEILGFLKRFNVGRQKGKGKRGGGGGGGDRITKFDREVKNLAWNVTDTTRKNDGGLGKGDRAYYYSL